jgi:hypothetical protein
MVRQGNTSAVSSFSNKGPTALRHGLAVLVLAGLGLIPVSGQAGEQCSHGGLFPSNGSDASGGTANAATVACGHENTASAPAAMAFGVGNTASGDYSSAMGSGSFKIGCAFRPVVSMACFDDVVSQDGDLLLSTGVTRPLHLRVWPSVQAGCIQI